MRYQATNILYTPSASAQLSVQLHIQQWQAVAHSHHQLAQLDLAAAALRKAVAVAIEVEGDAWSVEARTVQQQLEMVEAEARNHEQVAGEKMLISEVTI